MLHRIERKPVKEFDGIIEKIWLAPRRSGEGSWTFDILPDGNFDLLFILSEQGCQVFYTGPYTELRRVSLLDRYEYFCVRFRPGIMPRVADVTAADLVDSWAVLPNVLGASADELGEKLFFTNGLDARIRVIETFFRKSGLESSLPKGPFLQCASAVDAAHGAVRVDELAHQAGVSTRTIERMFREHVGIAPKTFIRNVRFQHAVSKLNTPASFTNLADLACACGYFDQSHFIKDFKALARRLPSAI